MVQRMARMSYILLAILHGACILNNRYVGKELPFSSFWCRRQCWRKILWIFFEKIITSEFQYMLVYVDGALTLNCYCTGYSRTRHLKACLYRARPRTRTRTWRSHWITYKQFVWSRFYQRRPRTRLEIGSCGKSQDCLWSEFLGDGRTNYFL